MTDEGPSPDDGDTRAAGQGSRVGDELREGRELLEGGEMARATEVLGRAFAADTTDLEVMSWYGLSLVLGGVDRLHGVTLCEAAVRRAGKSVSVDLLHNLGRAYLGARYRSQAAEVLRRGAAVDPDHLGIHGTLVEMGVRRRPLFPFLARSNPLNRYLGLLCSRLFPKKREEA